MQRDRAAVKEVRSFGGEIRVVATEKGKTLTGYAAVFNKASVDMGGWTEVIAPGAFTRTLKENPDVLALYSHNVSLVLGRTISNTLQLEEDDKGLRFTCLLPNTSTANDMIELIERGDIRGCSFGFITVKDSWTYDEKNNSAKRDVLDCDLIEVTVTAMPAYPQTSVGLRSVALRSMPLEMRSQMPCSCPCAQCGAGACNICSTPNCSYDGCKCPEQNSRRVAKTKTVDGEDLTADCFLIVLDPQKTDTWNLPWKFSTEEKTKRHLRDALARFDQVEDVPEAVKNEAWDKLLALCKQYGIDVSKDDERALQLDQMQLRVKIATLRAGLPAVVRSTAP